jgi:hypothetical protein
MLSPTVISNPGLYQAWQIAGAEQNEKPGQIGGAGQGFHVDGGWGRFWGWECAAVIELMT